MSAIGVASKLRGIPRTASQSKKSSMIYDLMNDQNENPLAPDAPLVALLSLKHNPLVAQMSQDQLIELVTKLRTLATSPQTLSAKLKSDGESVQRQSKAARRRALLEDL